MKHHKIFSLQFTIFIELSIFIFCFFLPKPVYATNIIDLRSIISVLSSIFPYNTTVADYGQTAITTTNEWTQDAHDGQRTGYTQEEPNEPWTYAWSWNGPDNNGGSGGNFYNGPLRDGRSITGGTNVYVPAADNGLYALAKTNGFEVWHFTTTAVDATPAYDSGNLYVAGRNGTVYKLNANSGLIQGSFNTGNQISKPVLLAGGSVYVVTTNGNLYKIAETSMTQSWVYNANSSATTSPAYSALKNLVIFATNDLYVHAVDASNGNGKWRVKPTSHTLSDHCGLYNYDFRWPVIAEQHGIVFIRLRNPWDAAVYGTTNSAIRSQLVANPNSQSLFALNLSDGSPAFIPAVAPTGADHRPACGSGNELFHSISSAPIVKVLPDGKEVAYIIWRNGQAYEYTYAGSSSHYDPRWDAFMGEMVLDNNTVSGLSTGDLRFVDFKSQISTNIISDEVHTISMAGNTIFHHHVCSVDGYTITNRNSSLGLDKDTPITTQRKPEIVRQWIPSNGANTQTHYSAGGIQGCEGNRYYNGPAFWIYQGNLAKDMLLNYAISDLGSEEGSVTRYTYVSDGLIITQGPRGDLFVLKHN